MLGEKNYFPLYKLFFLKKSGFGSIFQKFLRSGFGSEKVRFRVTRDIPDTYGILRLDIIYQKIFIHAILYVSIKANQKSNF